MAARKLTKSPEGEVVTFSTKRGKPDTCSETCGGIYRFKGELYCKYFHNVVGKRDEECIKNEVSVWNCVPFRLRSLAVALQPVECLEERDEVRRS